MGLKTTLPSQTDNDTNDDFDDVGNYLWLGLFGMFLFAMPIVGIVLWARNRKNKKRVASDAVPDDSSDHIPERSIGNLRRR